MPPLRLTLSALGRCGAACLLLPGLALKAGATTTHTSAAIAIAPLPPDQHLTDGEDRMMSGQLSPSADRTSRAVALYADALVAFEGREKDAQKALEELRQVVALDPKNDEARIRIANVLLQTGQIESAFEGLQTATANGRHSPTLEALLGYTQHLRGQNDEAMRLSRQALTHDPNQAISMRVLLETAAAQDDLAGAVLQVEDILKAEGTEAPASAWLTLGRLYLEIARGSAHSQEGDVVQKTLLPIYEAAAAKPPPDVERWTLVAQAEQDLGRNSEALKALRRAVELEPENVDILLRCARLELALGQKEIALKDFKQAYQLNPDLGGLREMLGQIYLDNKSYSDAVVVLQDALNASPGNAELAADLGLAFDGLHQETTAAKWFTTAFASPSCPPEAYLKLEVYQLSLKRIAEAGKTVAAARARFPQSAKVVFYEAIQNRYAKDYTAALACLAEMKTLASPDSEVFDPGYYLESELVLNLAGKQAEIEPLLREGLAKFPDNSDLMNELAFSWADAGTHLPEALNLSRRAVGLDPKNGAFEDTVGWIYFKMGEEKEALPYLQRAVLMTNNDPVVLEHLGDAWLRLDHRREALAAFRLAQKKSPDDHELTTRIATALAQANHANLRNAPLK